MTREEAIARIREHMIIHKSKEPRAIYITEALEMAIKALEAKDVLDKIREEIMQLPTNTRTNWNGCCPDDDCPEIEYVDVSKDKLLAIIDKYRAESEDENLCKMDGEEIDIDKAIEHYEGTLETLKDILEVEK